MTKSTFPGFPPQALKFFRALEKNNTREWFEANKQTFLDHVRAPMEQLVAEVSAALTRFAPGYATEPKKAIFRIYRDTRFSANKTPYKTATSALFFHPILGKNEAAGFYFEVSHRYTGVAAGLYMPTPDYLRAIRAHLLDHHQQLEKLGKNKALLDALGPIQGEQLSRPPKGFPADHPATGWIKHKQWYCWRELDASAATAPGLAGEIVARFRAGAPLVEFLNEPLFALRRNVEFGENKNIFGLLS